MSQRVLGGKSYKRYPDPSVSNLPNEYGLYPWSVLYARITFIDEGGEIKPITGIVNVPSRVANLLLFTSDIPALGQMKCYHTGAANAPYLNDITNEQSFPELVTERGGATPVSVKIGSVAKGYTGPGRAVFCTGFPAVAQFKVAGANNQTTDDASIMVWANNGVMSGPVSQNKDAGSTLVPQPIILQAEQYGPDFLTSDNIFTDTAGFKWLIVGLHTITLL